MNPLATATPKQFKIKHRAPIVGRPTRSYLALANGFAYIKRPRQLVCVHLREKRTQAETP
jgi:hypothetical protein